MHADRSALANKGSAPAITDTMAGRLQLIIDPVLNSTVALVKDGRLKLIGTMGTNAAGERRATARALVGAAERR